MSKQILKGPEITNIPNYATLGQLLYDSTEKYKNRICQIDADNDASETYLSVRLRSVRLAIVLQKEKLKPDDVVLICSSNTLDNCIPILATLFLAAKTVNLDPRLSLRMTKYLISLVNPKVIFVQDSSVELIEKALKDLEISTEIIIVIGQSKKYRCLIDLIENQPEDEEFKPLVHTVNDIALICFSSGTSNLPKPICHSHKTLLNLIASQGLNTQKYYKNDDISFQFTTFYWFSGILMLFFYMLKGGTRIFSKDTSAESTLKLIDRFKLTSLFIIPSFSYQLTKIENPQRFDTSSLRIIIVGGGAWVLKEFQRLQNLFQNAKIVFKYGMTEVGGISNFYMEDSNLVKEQFGSFCGKILPETFLKIVDVNTRKLLGPHQKGEICVKSPSLMLGYYNSDASSCFDSDGFLKTGDLGYFDKDEWLYFVERCKDMFRYLNWHILPTSIENVLMEHPDILETVVFGLPRDEIGEAPAACVVLRQDCCTTVFDIDEFVSKRVSEGEKLRGGIFIVNTLPKTPSGKIIRRQVREDILKTLSQS